MTKKERLTLLNQWQLQHDALDKAWQKMIDGIGVPLVGSPLWEVTWELFAEYTVVVGDLVGDTDWLEWYWLENSMGQGEKLAGYDGKLRPIRNLNGLERLVRGGMKR